MLAHLPLKTMQTWSWLSLVTISRSSEFFTILNGIKASYLDTLQKSRGLCLIKYVHDLIKCHLPKKHLAHITLSVNIPKYPPGAKALIIFNIWLL